MDEEYQKLLFNYLSNIYGVREIKSAVDIQRLSARELLQLFEVLEDKVFLTLVEFLKNQSDGESFFQKLMGDHEEENRDLVSDFFNRYMDLVLMDQKIPSHLNPLSLYMPRESLEDLAFVQSRQAFFLSQTMHIIQEYLEEVFGKSPSFVAGEQEKAWEYFWNRVLEQIGGGEDRND